MANTRARPGERLPDPSPHHWTNVTESHVLHAVRFKNGDWQLSYGRVDMGTRQIVSTDLGLDTHEPGCPDQVGCALEEAAARLRIDRSGAQRLW